MHHTYVYRFMFSLLKILEKINKVTGAGFMVFSFFNPRVTARSSAMVMVAVFLCRTISSSIWRALLTTASVKTQMFSSFFMTHARPNKSGMRRNTPEFIKTYRGITVQWATSVLEDRQTDRQTHAQAHTQHYSLRSADWLLWLTDTLKLWAVFFAVRSSWWDWTKMEDQRTQRRLIASVPSSQ